MRNHTVLTWELPIKVISEFNSTEHWRKKASRHRDHKNIIAVQFLLDNPKIELPVTITLTRLSPRKLDDDNLQGAFKWIRDAVSEGLIKGTLPGRADNDPRITWAYSQEKSKTYAVRICFSSSSDSASI